MNVRRFDGFQLGLVWCRSSTGLDDNGTGWGGDFLIRVRGGGRLEHGGHLVRLSARVRHDVGDRCTIFTASLALNSGLGVHSKFLLVVDQSIRHTLGLNDIFQIREDLGHPQLFKPISSEIWVPAGLTVFVKRSNVCFEGIGSKMLVGHLLVTDMLDVMV